MKRSFLAAGSTLLALAGCTSILGDFDVAGGGNGDTDSGITNGGGDATVGSDGHAAGDGASSGDATSGGDACADGACNITCSGGRTACGVACFDLTKAEANCGKCGHDCGGGQCANSVCQPQTLTSAMDPPTGFAVDSHGIYFAVDSVLKSCPLGGCASGITQIASLAHLTFVAAANGSVGFVADDPKILSIHSNPTSLFACPTGGCPASLTSIQGGFPTNAGGPYGYNALISFGSDLYFQDNAPGAFSQYFVSRCVGLSGTTCSSVINIASNAKAPIAADGTNAYFVYQEADGSTQTDIAMCPSSATCTTPTIIAPGKSPSSMAVYGGTIYYVTFYALPLGGGPIWSCPIAGCTTPKAFATLPTETVTDITADASGVYFTAGSSVYTCPLAGCGAVGPRPLATGQAQPTMVRTDAGFVYWVNAAAPDGGVAAASIMRVAKP